MDHKLSVLVQVDLDGRYVRLLVTGCLTEANQHALHPLIRRARTLIPPVTVSVDLTAAEHVEGSAVGQLRTAVDHDPTLEGTSPVELLLSCALPEHPEAPARMTRHLRAPGWLAA
ncbi:hypothetical protein [Kocuria turfanensis]|uniref:STAS domain-containing protein n=1 Tax=Kocuria turfanensis TaxID=388357 RepID=A0A512IE24_9MICC|nr:hypothetical protein [Kocuria turfanensis]GEO95952.1 hypothetical protein KTU01_20750 [Kocuria turfanensis]